MRANGRRERSARRRSSIRAVWKASVVKVMPGRLAESVREPEVALDLAFPKLIPAKELTVTSSGIRDPDAQCAINLPESLLLDGRVVNPSHL